MHALSASLGLAPHRVRTSVSSAETEDAEHYIAGPVDMEIHRTDDGRLNALDCHRLFPCEAPLPLLRPEGHVWPKCGHLVRLLRPEYIQYFSLSFQTYFSSDAYSKFAHYSVQNEDDAKVSRATQYLLKEHVPMFASSLDQKWRDMVGKRSRKTKKTKKLKKIKKTVAATISKEVGNDTEKDAIEEEVVEEAEEMDEMDEMDETVKTDEEDNEEDYEEEELEEKENDVGWWDRQDGEETTEQQHDVKERAMVDLLETLSNDMHGVGINMRMLGRVRRACTEPVVRALLVVEMLARVAKTTVRKELRTISVKARELPSRSHFIQTVVKHLNLLLGCNHQSHEYWENVLRPKMELKYEFSTHELKENENLKVYLMVNLQTQGRRMMVMSLLWSRLKESLGIEVHPRTNYELMKEDAPFIPSLSGGMLSGGMTSSSMKSSGNVPLDNIDSGDGVLIESEVLSISSRVKSPPVLSRAAAHILLERATEISRREHHSGAPLPPLPSATTDASKNNNKRSSHHALSFAGQQHTSNWHASRLFRLASFKALQSLDRAPTSADSLSLLGETRLREAAQVGARSKMLLESAHRVLSRAQRRAAVPSRSRAASPPSSPLLQMKTKKTETDKTAITSLDFQQEQKSLRILRKRCALLGAVAKLRLACLGHKSIETKRQLLVEACATLGSGLVNQWMEDEDMHHQSGERAAGASASVSGGAVGRSSTCFTLEFLLALFNLGILESVDPFFVDNGIARLHKALGVLRMGGQTQLRETPIGSLVESHINDMLGLFLSTSMLNTPSTSAEGGENGNCPPCIRVGGGVDASCDVLLLRGRAGASDAVDELPSSVVVSKDVVSIFQTLLRNETGNPKQGEKGSEKSEKRGNEEKIFVSSTPKLKRKRHDSTIVAMVFMHDERILITANKKEQIDILDVLSPTFVSRGKVVTGGDDIITSMTAHGETLAIGCASGLIRVLTIVGGEYLNRETNLPVRFESMLTGHSSKVMSLDLVEDSGQLLISGGLDRSVRIWDLRSGQLLFSLTRRWPGWGPVYSVAMLSAPLGTRCSIGEDTQSVAHAASLRRKVSLGNHNDDGSFFSSGSGRGSFRGGIKGRGSGNSGSYASRYGRKKAIAVATGDGGLRVWSLESLLSNEDVHRQRVPPACSRMLVSPQQEGLFGHSLQPPSPSSKAALRQFSSSPPVCTNMQEIDDMNCLVTGDTFGEITIWCQLSWVRVRRFQTTQGIGSLSVVRHCTVKDDGCGGVFNQETLLILTNGPELNNGGSSSAGGSGPLLHSIDLQRIV